MSEVTVKSHWSSPAFLVAVGVLLPAALGLNIAVPAMKLHFKKAPVMLARPLTDISSHFGNWVQISRDEPLDKDMEEVLGTDKYIFRDYLDVNVHGGRPAAMLIEALHPNDDAEVRSHLTNAYREMDASAQAKMLADELQDKTLGERKSALVQVQRQYPDAVVNMAVTYYTGLADTVAHIPDRCYVADGFEPSTYTEPNWTLADGRVLGVRFINFQDAGDTQRPDRSVAYFFQVNGKYVSDPLQVRVTMQNLLQKYGYYAKVELMTMDSDHDRSQQTMVGFLSQSLADVEKSFPDWSKYATRGAVKEPAK